MDAAYVGLIGVAVGGVLGALSSYFTTLFTENRARRADKREAARLVQDELARAGLALTHIQGAVNDKLKSERESEGVTGRRGALDEGQLATDTLLWALSQEKVPEIATSSWRGNQRRLARALEFDQWRSVVDAYAEVVKVRRIDRMVREEQRLPDQNPVFTQRDLERALDAVNTARAALHPLARS